MSDYTWLYHNNSAQISHVHTPWWLYSKQPEKQLLQFIPSQCHAMIMCPLTARSYSGGFNTLKHISWSFWTIPVPPQITRLKNIIWTSSRNTGQYMRAPPSGSTYATRNVPMEIHQGSIAGAGPQAPWAISPGAGCAAHQGFHPRSKTLRPASEALDKTWRLTPWWTKIVLCQVG